MSKKLMIDPPGGWKYGFPKFVGEVEGEEILDMTIDELTDYLLDMGYPAERKDQCGWCRFMWMPEDDER